LRKVVSHADVMSGKPHIVGTHVTVASILGKIAKGLSIREIARQLPQLSEEDVIIAIKYAEDVMSRPAI
jgi:uncharacterized protein (DUF433 family)